MVVRGRSSDENKQQFDAVIDSDILQHIKDKNWEQVKKIIHESTGVEIEVDT